MTQQTIDLSNLVLDDNTFELLPDGDYHFRVESHEVGYSTSNKLPANTQTITCHLEIPILKDGAVKWVQVKNNLNVYSKALFAIRQFAECIGLAPEQGRVSLDINQIDGKSGICSIETFEGRNNAFNVVRSFYPPSKAPVVTMNDDAWNKKDDFMEIPDAEQLPFV